MGFVRWASLVSVVIFFSCILSGCGVSQKKYGTLLSEKVALEERCDVLARANNALKNEYDSLLKDKMDVATRLESATNEKKALKGEYDKLLEEKIALRASYDKLVAENKTLKDRLSQAGVKTE